LVRANIDYVISILHFLGGDVHVVAVCQPSVPVLAAVARMEAVFRHANAGKGQSASRAAKKLVGNPTN